MSINQINSKKYDFNKMVFMPNSDIDLIISNFFTKHKDYIKGDKEYITYKIKKNN